MGMPIHHTAQERDGFCVPEMNVLWSKMCLKAKRFVKMLIEAGKSVIIHSEMSIAPTWAKRPLSVEEAITLKAT